ncbi:uncharacterized protein LOC125568296 [Nematostella vectensis]|uniref:uncharacterized protein LOC125568296 n=1 Tax=Nematostella vectensis TaxID=45351 RepID=UPI002077392F|nr:uncharacterized protein LOC125568296 [Nematostella vectensis]
MFSLSQHVKAPTRKNNYLDLVFSSNPGLIQACHVTNGLSDHEGAVLFEVDTSPKYTPKAPHKIYQYHKADYDGLRSYLSTFGTDYMASFLLRFVDENWAALFEGLKDALDKFVPHKMSKGKRHLPWVSPAIKRLMRKRDRAYKKAKRLSKEKNLRSYRRIRNYTTKCIRDTHNIYLSEVLVGLAPDPSTPNPGGAKRAWSYLKLLRSESLGIPTLFQGDQISASDSSKAEALRVQYESVFTQEDLTNIPVLGDSPYQEVADLTFTTNGIHKQLKNLQPNKASSPDSVPARILIEAAGELAPLLAPLFQQSYDSGSLPAAWKDANVTAIFKKGHRADPKNCRPVSLTSLISKVMEHVVCKHVTNHLCANHIITHLQHGFQQGLSCETQLTSVIHD